MIEKRKLKSKTRLAQYSFLCLARDVAAVCRARVKAQGQAGETGACGAFERAVFRRAFVRAEISSLPLHNRAE